MELRFDGRVAIVTGAGGGLGRAHALELARRGAAVVVNDIGASLVGDDTEDTPAESVAREIVSAGGDAVADTNSVASVEGGKAIVQTAIEAFGRVDVVVNNAGILRDKTFQNTSSDDVDPVLGVHLVGAFNVTRPAWLHFREQRYGRVVVTSSSAGLWGNFGQTAYSAAKMGLVGLIKALAIEGQRYNIAANAIAPIARTRMTEAAQNDLFDRLDPELISPVVTYLAHESSTLTGEILSAGGGRVARAFVGVTRGYVSRNELTAEEVRDSLDAIFDPTDYEVPLSSMDESNLLASMISPK